MNEINVCCPLFLVLPCGDTDEHCHVACENKGIICNGQATMFCLSEPDTFRRCPYYSPPRKGAMVG